MRILVISSRYPPLAQGGYELICAGIAEGLRASHDVLVLTSARGRRSAGDQPGVLRRLPLLGDRGWATALAPLAAVRAARTTSRVLADFRPDVVYVWNGSEIPQVVVRVLCDSGVPLVYSVMEHWFGRLYSHDPFLRYVIGDERGLRAGWSRVARLVNRHPALRLDPFAPSRAAVMWCSDALRRMTPTPPATSVVAERTIHPATPCTTAFAALERRSQSTLTIGFIGRLIAEKGPQIAYEALGELRSRHGIEARLVVAGPSTASARRALRRIADEHGIADAVELCGTLDEAGVGALLQRIHALVVPSLWEEPSGSVCLEAACARVPVVAARSGGMPEILRGGEHALYFQRGDAAACADALARTLTDTEDTEARVRRAFQRAEELSFERFRDASERFLWEAVAALGGQGAEAAPAEAHESLPARG